MAKTTISRSEAKARKSAAKSKEIEAKIDHLLSLVIDNQFCGMNSVYKGMAIKLYCAERLDRNQAVHEIKRQWPQYLTEKGILKRDVGKYNRAYNAYAMLATSIRTKLMAGTLKATRSDLFKLCLFTKDKQIQIVSEIEKKKISLGQYFIANSPVKRNISYTRKSSTRTIDAALRALKGAMCETPATDSTDFKLFELLRKRLTKKEM